MSDIEYDIIDELYFVTPYQQLCDTLSLPEDVLAESLRDLVVRGYVKCFYPDPDTELEYNQESFSGNFRHYFYLTTKAGLIVHNSR